MADRKLPVLLGLLFLLLAPLLTNFTIGSLLNPFGFISKAAAQDEVVQTDTTESIRGRLVVFLDGERLPVSGARVIVLLDGQPLERSDSDNDGRWEIELPGPGIYTVQLDVESLPEGVTLTDAERQILPDVEIEPGQSKTVVFRLGESLGSAFSRTERIANLVFSGLRIGAILALCSVGLSLVYGVSGLINFAHGEMVTMGALVAYFLHASVGGPELSLIAATIPAILICGTFWGGMEVFVWSPLRNRKTSLVSLALVTIGLSFVLRYFFAIVFGTGFRSYRDHSIQDPIEVGWITTTPKSMIVIIISVALLAGLGMFLLTTRSGIGIRAVAANRELASVAGINVPNVLLTVWVIGAALSGLGGIFYGITEQLDWLMGFRLLLLMFASVILGGIGTAFGAMAGGFMIGLITEVGTYWVDSEFQLVLALSVLILMLLVRPQGLLGRRERTA